MVILITEDFPFPYITRGRQNRVISTFDENKLVFSLCINKNYLSMCHILDELVE